MGLLPGRRNAFLQDPTVRVSVSFENEDMSQVYVDKKYDFGRLHPAPDVISRSLKPLVNHSLVEAHDRTGSSATPIGLVLSQGWSNEPYEHGSP